MTSELSGSWVPNRLSVLAIGVMAGLLSGCANPLCIGCDDDYESPPIEPSVWVYNYTVNVGDSAKETASGCIARRGDSYEDLAGSIELSLALETEYRLELQSSVYTGDIETGESVCNGAPGSGESFKRRNPTCYATLEGSKHDLIDSELVYPSGLTVEFPDGEVLVPAAENQKYIFHLVSHDYGLVSIETLAGPCAVDPPRSDPWALLRILPPE